MKVAVAALTRWSRGNTPGAGRSGIAAIRDAGFQLVREAGGGITVNVSPDMLHAEADGRLRSGFMAGDERDSTLEAVVRRVVGEALAEAGIATPRRKAA